MGYLARLRQGRENASPGAEFLLAVANQLSVSLDSLLTFDFSEATETEKIVLSFAEKLRQDTETQALRWKEDVSVPSMDMPVRPDGTAVHPLFHAKPVEEFVSMNVYHSFFRPDRTDLCPAKIYFCTLGRKNLLYLVAVTGKEDLPGAKLWTELEMVLFGPDLSQPSMIAHTDHDRRGRLDAPLARLFAAVKSAVEDPRLSRDALAVISDYLK